MADDRSKRMGGSDGAAVVGLSPYKTATDVFLEKTGRAPAQAVTEPMNWGNILEPVILDEYARRTGLHGLHRNRMADGTQQIIRHDKHPWLAGAPDAWTDDRVVDAKSTGSRQVKRWGREGTDDMPEEHLVQVTLYADIRKVPKMDVPVLIDGRTFRIYSADYDPEFAGNVIQILERFWVDNVLADKPPKPESTEERLAQVRAMYPENRTPIKISDRKVDLLAMQLSQAKEAIDSNEVLYESAKALIMEAIGDGEGIGGDWGRVLFRKAKDSQVINWEQVARDVAMWSHFPVAKFMELMQSHTTTKMGSRRFLFQPRRTKEDA